MRDSENIGYHAGDLGKSEFLGQQYGSNRGTGHFGTGTYFVGKKENIDLGDYKGRPQHAVNFGDYNLYTPTTASKAESLHDALKYMNTYYLSAKRRQVDDATMETLKYGFVEDIISTLKSLGKFDENYFKELTGYSSDDFIENQVQNREANRYMGRIIDGIKDEREVNKRAFSAKEKFESNVEYLFGISAKEAEKIISGIYKDIENANDDDEGFLNLKLRKSDSVSTRFMKALGYEGVDVRHIPSFDNTKYGSVIYDIKNEDIRYRDWETYSHP